MLRKRQRNREAEIPQGSLADIAFLLLIFFLVTTTINMDKGISLVLPEEGQETEVAKKNISNLLVNAQGLILLDEKPIKLQDVEPVVKKKLEANPKLIISVKTDRRTEYQRYIDVLDELKQANATRISVAEPEKN